VLCLVERVILLGKNCQTRMLCGDRQVRGMLELHQAILRAKWVCVGGFYITLDGGLEEMTYWGPIYELYLVMVS